MNNVNINSFTYHDKQHGTKSRLDYILTSNKLLEFNKCCEIVRSSNPQHIDHDLVKLRFEVSNRNKGPNYWKLNTSLLENHDYIILINEVIKKTIIDYKNSNSKQLLWEILKIHNKESSIDFASKLEKFNKSKITELQEKLNRLKQTIENQSEFVTAALILEQSEHTK